MNKKEVKKILVDAINSAKISTKVKEKKISFPKKLKKKHVKALENVCDDNSQFGVYLSIVEIDSLKRYVVLRYCTDGLDGCSPFNRS